MAPIFSSGTILLRRKSVCSKRMRRLISISVNYMLDKQYIFIHIYTKTLSAFPCDRTLHVRRTCMRSSIVSMIQSFLKFRFIHVIPHYYTSGNISSPFYCKERFCDSVSLGIIPTCSSVKKCCVLFSNYFVFPKL